MQHLYLEDHVMKKQNRTEEKHQRNSILFIVKTKKKRHNIQPSEEIKTGGRQIIVQVPSLR